VTGFVFHIGDKRNKFQTATPKDPPLGEGLGFFMMRLNPLPSRTGKSEVKIEETTPGERGFAEN